MDLKEAWQRIVVRHWVLILVCTLLGLAVPLVVDDLRGQSYVGSARVDLGPDPHGGQDSTSLGDTGQGLATSPKVLTAALEQAKVSRSVPDMIANSVVSVTPVGTSGVLAVSVTDADPGAAAAIANALAGQIVQRREDAEFSASQRLLADLQNQQTALTQQITAVIATEKRYLYVVPGLQAQEADLVAQRSAVDQRLQALSQQLTTAAHPQVIDDSARVGIVATTSLVVLLALGGVLGLVLGVALAATIEATRPTLSPAALARHLGAAVLGALPRASRGVTPLSPWLASYVGVAAKRAGKGTVQLVPVGRRPRDVTSLAEALDLAVAGARVLPLSFGRGRHAADLPAPVDESDVGIVVVTPRAVKARYLADLERHVVITGEPVLGLISFSGRLQSVQSVPSVPSVPSDPVGDEVSRLDDEPVVHQVAPAARASS